MLRVDGVPPETKKQLQEAARQLYGKPNASLLVRSLIAGHLSKSGATAKPLTAADAGDTVRVELRLPRAALEQVNDLAEGRFSARNYYLTSVILAHLGQPQLHGDEIEVLRRSNYELAKKLLASGVPPKDVAKNLGVSIPTLYRWVPASTHA